jgi:hypothetical protein
VERWRAAPVTAGVKKNRQREQSEIVSQQFG